MKKIQKSGITIVTLVITIIILVLLTGAVMLTMNKTDIFGNTQNTVDEHNKQAMLEQIRLKIETARLTKINNGERTFTIKEDIIPVVKNFGTYEEETLKLTTREKNIEIYLYEILNIKVEEYVTATYKDKILTITEKEESLSSNGYKYEYTYDNGIIWQTYTGATTIQEQSGIKVRIVNSEGQVISNEYVVTKGAGEETVNKIKLIAVTKAPTTTTYVQGQTFNPSGMEITVTYEDNTTKVVTNYNYTPTRTLTVSDRYITISYTENGVTKQATQNITVTNKLTAIGITELKKTKYKQGETINKSDIVVKATYEDNTNKQVTNFTYEPTGALQASDTSIIVTYTEDGVTKQASKDIQVTYITALEITSEPSVEFKTTYIKGENFDPTGLIVSVIYEDRNALPVTNYEIVNGTNLQVGTNEIVIRYTEGGITVEKEIPITVTNNVTGIVVTKAPDKTTYNHNEEFNKTGMVVTVNYQNVNDSRTLQENEYTVSTPTYGQNYVTITHTETGMTTTQAVTVNRVLASIEVFKNPDKMIYCNNESFDTSGMELKVIYTDGGFETITSGYNVTENLLAIGTTEIEVSYQGKTTKVIGIVVTYPTLASQIDINNYGDAVSYTANSVTNWTIFYEKENERIFLISNVNIGSRTLPYSTFYEVDTEITDLFMLTNPNVEYTTGYTLTNVNNSNKAVSWLMYQDNWKAYVNSKVADYAIGAPTVQMTVARWNALGNEPLLNCSAMLENYGLYFSTGETTPNVCSINVTGGVLGFEYSTSWFATPVAVGQSSGGISASSFTVAGSYDGGIGKDGYLYRFGSSGGARSYGLYPVVALKKDIRGYYDEGTSKWILVDME